MSGRAAGLIARVILATGLCVSAQIAGADSPPLKSIEPDIYSDQPAGIKYGSLLYNASLVSGTVWDSNIFSSKGNVVADRILFIRPGLSISTLDPNYKLTFHTSVDHLEYEKVDEEGRTDPRADLEGTIRVQRDLEIDVGLSATRVHKPRSIESRDLPGDAAEPVAHNQYAARLGLRRSYNPLMSTTTVSYENDNYFNVRSNSGTVINLQYLDRDIGKISHEADLKLSHRLLLFSRQRVIASDYRDVRGFNQRDSVKYEVVNGIEVAFTPLIKGKFSFHFGEEDFSLAAFESDPERIYSTELTWSPRRNLRIKASVERDFGGINFGLDSVGGRRTRADLVLDYAITQQWFFRANVHYQHANEAAFLAGVGRVEDTYRYKASLGYEMNRFWSLFLDYAYQRRDANFEINEFERHIIQTGVVGRF